jgi:nicotinate-nucleotide pyrophosphorylase (carboxylating)
MRMTAGMTLQQQMRQLVAAALVEDHASADATTLAVVPAAALAKATILARAPGVLSGCQFAETAFLLCDDSLEISWFAHDGSRVEPGDLVLTCTGSATAILAAERVALNFLQQLSGVATLTSQAVARAGTVKVLDTRKTVPGLRDAQKAAVVHGGGINQRRDLEDELLLKENHFALSGLGYAETVAKAVAAAAGRVVGVEAETLEQAEMALAGGASYVLLDNFRGETLRQTIRILHAKYPHAELEASGGFTIAQLPILEGTGVDRVSMGSLTHSVCALDLSLLLEPR